jgi:hypothetical protein
MFYVRRRGIKRYTKTVVLFDKKSNMDVRKIRFRNSKDFEQFIEDFRLMRYPGYDWRLIDRKK